MVAPYVAARERLRASTKIAIVTLHAARRAGQAWRPQRNALPDSLAYGRVRAVGGMFPTPAVVAGGG
jgi:hypothetical protein